MKKFLPIIVIVIIVALGASLFALNNSDDQKTESQGSGQTTQASDSDSSNNSDDQDKAVATEEVEIEDFAFSPARITVKKGTTVTWTNKDDVEHNVAFDDGGGAEDAKLIGKNESVSFTFNKTGEFAYHCSPHPYMKATVVVTD